MSELLKSANELYQKQKYTELEKLLIKNKTKFDSDYWHYNLGSVYLKNGNLGFARYHLELAKTSKKFGPMANHNINYINNNEEIVDIGKSESFIEQGIGVASTTAVWSYGSATLFFLILSILSFRFLSRAKTFAIIFLSLATLPISFYFIFKSNFKEVVIVEDVFIREGPSAIYSENSIIVAGSKVFVELKKDNWFLIKYPSRFRGWIDAKKVKLLHRPEMK